MVSVAQRREAARYLVSRYDVSERRACSTVRISRSVHRYQSRRPPDDALRRHIREIAETRLRYGFQRIHILLRRQGMKINRVEALQRLSAVQPGQEETAAAAVVADTEEEIGLALETPAAEPESASSRNHRLITSLIGGARG